MTSFFLAIYRFFRSHRIVFYVSLLSSLAVFIFFGLQIKLEENISTLLPKTEKSSDCAIAFSNVKVKDKIFLEVVPKNGQSPAETAVAMDSCMTLLIGNDDRGFIGNYLYRIDTDDIMNLVYYGMDAFPCHFSEAIESAFDTLLTVKTFEEAASGSSPLELPQTGFALIDSHLFAPDSAFALAFISPGFDALDSKTGNAFETYISRNLKQFEKTNPGFEVCYHGSPIEGTFNSRQIKKDIYGSVGICLIIICIFIALSFRCRSTLLHLLLPVVYGTFFSLACIKWIIGSLSIIALGIGAIVLGVALSYCLHVITHHKFVSDVETIIRDQAKPVCLGCITTIGAFAGLLFTSSDLLKGFGIFASLALVGTTFFSLAFLPQFFNERNTARNERIFGWIDRFNSLQPDKNRYIVSAMVLIALIGIAFSGKVKFDSDLNNIGYKEPKVVASEQLYAEHVNGSSFNMFFAAHSSDQDSAIVLSRALRPTLDSLKSAGLINSYSGADAFLIPYEEQLSNIERWKAYWTPERKASAFSVLKETSDRYGWNESTGFDIPETFRLMTEAEFSPVSLYEYGALPEGLMCNFVEQNADGWLVFTSVQMDKANKMQVCDAIASQEGMIVLNPFYYTGDMVEIVHSDFNIVLLVSSIFVFLVLLLSFRSLTVSIIAFLPMLLSWYILQGIMALTGLEFNLINIMISTFVFGIGVDYSIFVMTGLLGQAQCGDNRLLLCHKSAIFFSGISLIVVIGSLVFATHPAIRSTGVTSIIGMVTTILITYILQPLLFRVALKSGFLRKKALKQK